MATYFAHSRLPKFKVTAPNKKTNVCIHFVGKFPDLLLITCLPVHVNFFICLQFHLSWFLILGFLTVNIVAV